MTKDYKRLHWEDLAKKLNLWEIRLIELRNAGESYSGCRDALQQEFPRNKKSFNSNQRLRDVVSKKLKEPYLIYSALLATESLEQGQLIIKNLHKRAAMTLGNLLHQSVNDSIRLHAAITILERNAGKPTQLMEVNDNAEMEELRKQVAKLNESSENTRMLSNAIKKHKNK